MKLWPKGIPRRTRFHDLRHTTATLLLKEGVPMAVVQKILRHSDITVTEGVYGHLDSDDVRQALAKLPLRGLEGLAAPAPGFHPGREVARKVAADSAAKSLSGNDEGRDPTVFRAKSRPSESGRQDLKSTDREFSSRREPTPFRRFASPISSLSFDPVSPWFPARAGLYP